MTGRMIHPGPKAAERAVALPTRLVPVAGRLKAGETVMQGVARIFADAGLAGGVLWLDGLVCQPMLYVLPALSTDGIHAAWYSNTYAPEGPMRIIASTAIVGRRDGAPFLHCHGIWQDMAGTRAMGHLLPFDSVVAEAAEVAGLGALDAVFEAAPDTETAFTLFRPVPASPAKTLTPQTLTAENVTSEIPPAETQAPVQSSPNGALNAASDRQTARTGAPSPALPSAARPSPAGLLARILPGEDVITSIQSLAARHGITEARLHGIGSIDHVVFQDGSRMECLATELRLTSASLHRGRARIGIDVVDIDGTIARGPLTQGANPVGVTLELVIEPLPSPEGTP